MQRLAISCCCRRVEADADEMIRRYQIIAVWFIIVLIGTAIQSESCESSTTGVH